MKYLEQLSRKWFQITVLILIPLCIVLQFVPPAKLWKKNNIAKVTLKHIRQLYKQASAFEHNEDNLSWAKVFNKQKQVIGFYTSTAKLDGNFLGFGGPVPLIIGLNLKNQIIGVTLLDNAETESYIEKLEKRQFFKQWNGLNPQQAPQKKVDIVSGATMTSGAVISNLQTQLAGLAQVEINTDSSFLTKTNLKTMLALMALVLAFLSFRNPGKWSRHRLWLLLSNTIILGGLCGYFISTELLFNWTINGINYQALPVMTAMVLFSLLTHLLTSKPFYCMFLCPFGAIQELIGKIKKNKPKLPKSIHHKLGNLRPILLITILFFLLIGEKPPLTEMEPFSIFMFDSASPWIIGLASIFLLISILSPRFWCKYFCPTGQINQFMCKKIKPE